MHEYGIKQIAEQTSGNIDLWMEELKEKYDNEKYYYDEIEARKFYNFVSKLETDKGKKNQKIKLLKFQFDICTSIICVKYRETNYRRYRECHINIPRKNGKGFIIACIITYLYFCKNEFGSSFIVSANTTKQSQELFDTINYMIEHNKTLKKYVAVNYSIKKITKKNMNSKLFIISSEAKNADSYAGMICCIDEIHEAKNGNLYDKLRTGMGIWQEPLLITLTTASSGSDPHNLEMELYTYSKSIEKGENQNESFFYAIFEADEKCDPLDEIQWFKSNPALGTFRKYEDMVDLSSKIKILKTRETAFRRLYLNQHVSLDIDSAINMDYWDECTEDITLENLRGMSYCGGVDMSLVQDITAFVQVFYDEDKDKYIVYPHLFTPKDTLPERIERDNVRYDIYSSEEMKELILIEGRSINVEHMVDYIEKLNTDYEFKLKEIAYDRFAAKDFISKLENKYDVAPMGQGFLTMTPAIRDFENLLTEGKLIIPNNSFFRWMAKNVIMRMDEAGNVKFNKERSKKDKHYFGQIDGIVAMVMGLSRAIFNASNKTPQLTEEDINSWFNKVM